MGGPGSGRRDRPPVVMGRHPRWVDSPRGERLADDAVEVIVVGREFMAACGLCYFASKLMPLSRARATAVNHATSMRHRAELRREALR